MTDTPNPEFSESSTSTPPPMPPSSATDSGSAMSAAEIADGKLLAILSYVFPIVAVVVLFIRNNNFALYHAKQILVPLILLLVMCAAGIVLSFIPFAFCLTAPAMLIGCLAFFVFVVMGLINAIGDKAVPLPLTGRLAESWFAGIQKLPT